MRQVAVMGVVLVALGVAGGPVEAAVDIRVDLATETMHVTTASGETYAWPVSTARHGFVTPNGTYGVQSLEAMHYSRKYHDSPMPHSIFFHGGYAIHGTYEIGALGRPASHGCIRLSPRHASELFDMVRTEGARITITGSTDPVIGSTTRGGRRLEVAESRRGARLRRGLDDGFEGDEKPFADGRARHTRTFGDLFGDPLGAADE